MGHRVTIRWYAEPKIGTLITWEYEGHDPQELAVILQKELGKAGVVLK